ncbi:MAG: transposase [Gammaproteobacteria bacterium]
MVVPRDDHPRVLHLPHCPRAPGGAEGAELANRPDQRAAACPVRCVDEQGFKLHAEVCCAAHQRKNSEARHRDVACWARRGRNTVPLYHPPRHCQRAPRSQPCRAGRAHPEDSYREGTTHIVMSPLEFLQRLAALVPDPRLHLIRFHGVLAPETRPGLLGASRTPSTIRTRPRPCKRSCVNRWRA